MSYIQKPSFARSLVACAIASVSLVAIAQEAKQETPEEISGPADPIVVTATRVPTRYNRLISDVSVVDRETMQEYGPQAQISDVLRNESGITVNTNGTMGTNTTVQIRGASNNQSILLIDGMRLSSVANGGPSWAYIPMQQIGRMEIVRGPTSSSYGSEAIGGVIQLFTRKGEGPTKFYADAGYGTYGTSSETVGVEGSVEGLSYSLYGGNTHSLGLPTLTNPSTDFNPNSAAYVNSNASTRLAYTIAPGQELGVTALYGNGYNNYTTGGNTRYQTQLLSVMSAYTQNKILDDWQSLVRFGQSVDTNRNYFAGGAQDGSFRSTQTQAQWQNDINLPVGKGLLVYEYLQQNLDSTQTFAVTSRNINTVQAGWNGDVGNNLFQANVRNDSNSQFGSATTGSAGYGYFLWPTLRATAAWGTGFRAPTFNELYWVDSSPYGWNGNPNLQPEKSQNSEGGFRYDNGVHRAGVIYHYNYVTNLIQNTDYTAVNVSQAVLQGWSFTYGGKVYGLDVAASYDNQDARDTQTGSFLPYRPANFGSLTVSKKQERWDFGGQMQVSGSQQSNPGNVNPANNDITMGGYTLFNIFGSVNLIKDVSLFVRGNNVFNRQYSTNANGYASSTYYGTTYPATANYFRSPGSNFFVGLRFDTR
ncbi:MAG: TonB-dependent receptor domain-containing protein [Fluviibacter phosphoraccumulans]|jgi:vitamin B12 transporter